MRNITWATSLVLALGACSHGEEPNDSTGSGGGTLDGSGGVVGSAGGAGSGGGPSTGGGPSSSGGAPDGSGGLGPASGGTASGGDGPVGPASGLPSPPGDANVSKPSGTPGDVTVLDWAGFKAAVTYSFDDNTPSQLENYSTLNDLGVPFTFYLWTSRSDNSAKDQTWKTALTDGHELGNHTSTHPNTQPAQNVADTIVDEATAFIQDELNTKPWTMAAPNGHPVYSGSAEGRFFINRGTDPASPVLPNDSSDPFFLNCYIPLTGQPTDTFNDNIDSALSAGGWVIYVVHGFTGDTGGAFQPVGISEMIAAIQYAKDKGNVWIDTMVDIGAYWLGQKAFSLATSSTSGTDTTWTWTLPGQFPTGKYLRVKVDGGTLKQDGEVLAWDPHGYYEVALDAKSLTVSP